jgi:hypothetical protein
MNSSGVGTVLLHENTYENRGGAYEIRFYCKPDRDTDICYVFYVPLQSKSVGKSG